MSDAPSAPSALVAVQSLGTRARQLAIVDAETAELVRAELWRFGRASQAVWAHMPLPTLNLYGGERPDHWKVLRDEIVTDAKGARRYNAVAIHKSGEVHDVTLDLTDLPEAVTVEDVRPTHYRYEFDAACMQDRRAPYAVWSREAITDALIAAQEGAGVEIERLAAEQAVRQAASAARQAKMAGLTARTVQG